MNYTKGRNLERISGFSANQNCIFMLINQIELILKRIEKRSLK